MITASRFWKNKFGEFPKTEEERLAIIMMEEYADLAWIESAKKVIIDFSLKVINEDSKNHFELKSGKYVFKVVVNTLENFEISKRLTVKNPTTTPNNPA